jgi:hypothetical protein
LQKLIIVLLNLGVFRFRVPSVFPESKPRTVLNSLDFITFLIGVPIIKTNKRRIFPMFRNFPESGTSDILSWGHGGCARDMWGVSPQRDVQLFAPRDI